jgi:hypothetical protein
MKFGRAPAMAMIFMSPFMCDEWLRFP